MKVFVVFILVTLFVSFDMTMGDEYCCREFHSRKYIPKYAKGLKSTDLVVQYDHIVKCGETVSFFEARNAPTLKFDVTNKCINVTILAFQPDPLLNPQYPLLLVVNVPSSELKKGFNNGGNIIDKLKGHHQGNVIATYIDPEDPSSGLGVHNLTTVYFIYCQCHYISDLRLYTRLDRLNFKIKPYMEEHGLKCPVAGFFHQMSFTGITVEGIPVKINSISGPKDLPNPELPLPTQ